MPILRAGPLAAWRNVHDIVATDHAVCIATDGGLGIIRYEPYTLLKKAAYFQREMNEWGFKRLGFVHKLYWGGDAKGWLREISDNDGGNTSYYLSAMTFKYAVTGDEAARQEALDSFKAMVWLDEIKDRPGFIARAIWSVKGDAGERSTRGSGGLPAKWYPTQDGLWLWKGDTSSDEVNAHFFSVALFHDLAAQGKARSARPSIWPISHRTSSPMAGCCGTWTANPPAGAVGTPTISKRLTGLSRAGSTAWRRRPI